jgi:diguanylate cyclase (GGDEF)-like protein/PAS domain S-box-containing protein
MKRSNRAPSSQHGALIVDRSGTILGFDRAMETLTGWPAVEIVGHTKQLVRTNRRDSGRAIASVELWNGEIPILHGSRNLPLSFCCRDGRQVDVEAVAQRLDGPGERMLVSIVRVLARSAAAMSRETGAERDELTGLIGPNGFSSRLTADFGAAAISAQPLALVLADIDRLREINDRAGRAAGDNVLVKLAGILRVSVEDENRVFRLGDDDFAVLLPSSGRGEARQLAASLRSTVERHRFFSDGGDRRVTLSLGAASFPADAESGSHLLERAREALGEARSMGRNRVWCYLRRPRVPLEVPVYFDGAESSLVGYTRDLSPSGIFVQTSAPIEIGMRCALTFPLPGSDGNVHVIGRVVRTVPPQHESLEPRIPGMGVEFERFGGTQDRRAIEIFLHEHESMTLRPEVGPLSL